MHDFTRIQTLCSRALLVKRSVDACVQALIHEQKIMRARAHHVTSILNMITSLPL